MKSLNTDFLEAKPIVLPYYKKIAFYLIGCGGNGSWLATTICRLARLFHETHKPTQVTFIDPDFVENKNLVRQNFCYAEIGLNKAQALALRYSAAWGIEIRAIDKTFNPNILSSEQETLTLLIGCVDNAQARQSIAKAIETHQYFYQRTTNLWWLDCGNHATSASGQVLLGSHLNPDKESYQLHELGCVRLPAPTLQHPELLIPQPEELTEHQYSCEELAIRNTQCLGINQMVAAYASEYLIQLTTGQLKRFATYFDLKSGAASSSYTTYSSIIQAIHHF